MLDKLSRYEINFLEDFRCFSKAVELQRLEVFEDCELSERA
jgi:hypothetical protein